MLFAFSVCSGLFIITLVEDREKRLRHILKVVGTQSTAYFFGNLIADLLVFVLCTVIFIGLLYPLDLAYLYRGWQPVLAIMSSFGFALITLTYLASFVFKQAVYAFDKIGMWYMIIGLALPMVLTLVLALALAFSRSGDWIFTWMYVLLIDPFWPLAQGLIYVI
jgi:hypothetical protein